MYTLFIGAAKDHGKSRHRPFCVLLNASCETQLHYDDVAAILQITTPASLCALDEVVPLNSSHSNPGGGRQQMTVLYKIER